MNILVTGGASGLGKDIVLELLKNPLNKVYFTYAGSKSASEEIESNFSNSKAIHLDFTNQESINSLKTFIVETDLDTLVNNAITGINQAHFHKTEQNIIKDGFLYNVLPTVEISQAAVAKFRKNKNGKVLFVLSSFAVGTPQSGYSVYTAEKKYLHSIAQSIAVENRKFNVVCNSISPEFMKTGLTADTDERIIENMIHDHPLKKLLSTKEVAKIANDVLTSTNHLNGVNIPINSAGNVI